MTNRRILIVDLRDDPALIAAYERHHQPGSVWPEVIAAIRARGVHDMHIYRLGTRLVMVMEVADDFDPVAKARADAADPVVQRWEALMEQFQEVGQGGEKWQEMAEIFALPPHSADVERVAQQ